MGGMLKKMLEEIEKTVEAMKSSDQIDNAEYNLINFCTEHNFSIGEAGGQYNQLMCGSQVYLEESILGQDGEYEKEWKEPTDDTTFEEWLDANVNELDSDKIDEMINLEELNLSTDRISEIALTALSVELEASGDAKTSSPSASAYK